MSSKWETAQKWELDWHSNCVNSFHEEEKQLVYAEKMGLIRTPTLKTPYNFDLGGKCILDIGGGAYSLLLKCVNFKDSYVIDPLMSSYPQWVLARYEELGVYAHTCKGEDVDTFLPNVIFDISLIYNVLEHTEDPEKVVKNALKMSKEVRSFEWVNTSRGVNIGHIHSFTPDQLNDWFGGEGKVEKFNRNGCVGLGWFGIFKGQHYDISKR